MKTSSSFFSRARDSVHWGGGRLTDLIVTIVRIPLHRPFYTVVTLAGLASFCYIGLLEGSLSDTVISATGKESSSPFYGIGRRPIKRPDTTGTWQGFSREASAPQKVEHLALVTLLASQTAVTEDSFVTLADCALSVPANISITAVPPTIANTFDPYVRYSVLDLSVSYHQLHNLLWTVQELSSDVLTNLSGKSEQDQHTPRWTPNAVPFRAQNSFETWTQNAWINSSDHTENAKRVTIVVMVLMYFIMQSNIVSVFRSMRRMGCLFWLAAGVLFSSLFAFLFGLLVTIGFGIPVKIPVLFEGLPFLIVMVGFEKHVSRAQAVFSHAARVPTYSGKETRSGNLRGRSSLPRSTIVEAIKKTGFNAVKVYAIEIAILTIGAVFGAEAGLRYLCFRFACVLFFDCILLFSFYAAILCIKLEVKKITRRVDIRGALAHDGISYEVAESIAQSSWPGADGDDHVTMTILGQHARVLGSKWFKFITVLGSLLFNALNTYAIPPQSANSLSYRLNYTYSHGNVITDPFNDTFRVASGRVDVVLAMAEQKRQETFLPPIRYALELSSRCQDLLQGSFVNNRYASAQPAGCPFEDNVMGSVLKSLGDSSLAKWALFALFFSIAFNSYLFEAATARSQDHGDGADRLIDPLELAHTQDFNDADTIPPPLQACLDLSSQSAPTTEKPVEILRAAMATQAVLTECSGSGVPPAARTQEQLEEVFQAKRFSELLDEEIVGLGVRGQIPGHALEKALGDFKRAVKIRRIILSRTKATEHLTGVLCSSRLPYEGYDWTTVYGACCENVIGYMPIPVGVAGPLVVDGQSYFIPMATTEGVLVASTSRGCKAINARGGACTVLVADGMTRAPVVTFGKLERAGAAKLWLDSEHGRVMISRAFNSTSRFARLESIKVVIAGTHLFIRFKATTGDAMGMNMISKGVEHALDVMTREGFADMSIVSLSGNYCADKKASAVNWIEGRGKSVVAEAIIPNDIVKSVLKTDVDTLVKLNQSKNLIGSAVAGSIGGFNAHAANIVAAMFIATGQDPAQVVESANCITIMTKLDNSLRISVSMPSLEVATLGGGTILEPQAAMLDMLGVQGPHATNPGENARKLARIIAAVTLAGELSLCSALATGHLVRAHMQYNRREPIIRASADTSA